MLNPLMREFLGSLVRSLLNVGAGWLIANGLWTSSEAEKFLPAIALGVVSVGWSIRQKYSMRTKLVTAMAMPSGVSENQVKAVVKNPLVATPSVTLAKDQVGTLEPTV